MTAPLLTQLERPIPVQTDCGKPGHPLPKRPCLFRAGSAEDVSRSASSSPLRSVRHGRALPLGSVSCLIARDRSSQARNLGGGGRGEVRRAQGANVRAGGTRSLGVGGRTKAHRWAGGAPARKADCGCAAGADGASARGCEYKCETKGRAIAAHLQGRFADVSKTESSQSLCAARRL